MPAGVYLAVVPADKLNSHPRNVVPRTTTIRDIQPVFSYTLPSHRIVVLKLKSRS
ncbi:MAG: hypothetical protein ACLQVY_14925 [Limisphaerales bacterium]